MGVASLEGSRVSVPAREVRLDLRAAASPRSRSARLRGRRAAVLLLTGALLAQAFAALLPVAAIAAPADQGITAPVAPAAPIPAVTVALDLGKTGSAYTGFNSSRQLAQPAEPHDGRARPTGASGAGRNDRPGRRRPQDGWHRQSARLTDINPLVPPLRALGPLGLNVGIGLFAEPFSFAWSNGTNAPPLPRRPGRASSTTTRPRASSPGDGFSFSVPTTTSPRSSRSGCRPTTAPAASRRRSAA